MLVCLGARRDSGSSARVARQWSNICVCVSVCVQGGGGGGGGGEREGTYTNLLHLFMNTHTTQVLI